MLPLRLLPALLLAVVSSVWASDPAVPPELRGILFTGQDHRFALVGSGAEYSRWASLGETVEGWKLVEYSPADNALVLNRDHQQVTVRLRTSTVGGAGTSTGVQATLANADEVLHKMKFEAMWDRIAAEQKKAIVGAMRQQATIDWKDTDNLLITVRPMVAVSGTLLDGNGKPPDEPMQLAANYKEQVNATWNQECDREGSDTKVGADGSFNAKLPAGRITVVLLAPPQQMGSLIEAGSSPKKYRLQQQIDIPVEGMKGLRLKTSRAPTRIR